MTRDALAVLEDHKDDIEAVCNEVISLRDMVDDLEKKAEALQHQIDNHECEV